MKVKQKPHCQSFKEKKKRVPLRGGRFSVGFIFGVDRPDGGREEKGCYQRFEVKRAVTFYLFKFGLFHLL